MRVFDGGAIRDTEDGKLDYEGFLSPIVLERYAQYMHKHRKLPDGSMRGSDNWQSGMGPDVWMKSAWRHFMDLWATHRGQDQIAREGVEEALCGLLFNTMGYMHERLAAKAAPKPVVQPEPSQWCGDDCGCKTVRMIPRNAMEGL